MVSLVSVSVSMFWSYHITAFQPRLYSILVDCIHANSSRQDYYFTGKSLTKNTSRNLFIITFGILPWPSSPFRAVWSWFFTAKVEQEEQRMWKTQVDATTMNKQVGWLKSVSPACVCGLLVGYAVCAVCVPSTARCQWRHRRIATVNTAARGAIDTILAPVIFSWRE